MQILKNYASEAWSYVQDSPILEALTFTILALVILKFVSLTLRKITARRFSAQAAMLCEKALWYGGFVVITIVFLVEMGVELAPILGAAGIAGIAIGFASQSSLSNIISGLFLVAEKPFEVGDLIRVDTVLGLVQSIDLLSIKVRTFDNQFIRIPNEYVIKTVVTNITRFPIRRMDINVLVAYKENLKRVVKLLKEVAQQNPAALDEPEPLILVKEFGESGIEILFGIWFNKPDYLAVKNSMMMDVKAKFDKEGIEIPFPHRTVYTGLATKPFPIENFSNPESPQDS